MFAFCASFYGPACQDTQFEFLEHEAAAPFRHKVMGRARLQGKLL